MKVAIYIRVSTEEQVKEGYSISAQKRKLKAFCIAQDWEIAGLYADEGISAKDMKRPDLQRMIKDIEAGLIDCVLVWRLDRLTRSVFDLYKLLEVFDKYDCKFKSATEVYDTTTAMGRMFITIVAALAQWERENMGERIAMGFAEKVRQGKYALNFRPFGYDLDLKTGELSINSKEAKTVKLIYDLYLKGYGANRICKYLNDPARQIRTRDGNTWNDKPLMQLIKNPLYKGCLRWNDFVIENTHEPIVSEDVWERAQLTVIKNRNSESRSVSSDYIFSGKLRCNKCGSAMTGQTANQTTSAGRKVKYRVYRCTKGKSGECQGGSYLAEPKLEAEFLKYLEDQDFSKMLDETAAAGEKALNRHTEHTQVDIEHLEKELEKIERRKKKWQYAWSDDDMTDADFKKRMAEAKEDEEEIRAQLEKSEAVEIENENISKEDILSGLHNIKDSWYTLETAEKKQSIDLIIERIHYNVEKVGKNNVVKIESIDFA